MQYKPFEDIDLYKDVWHHYVKTGHTCKKYPNKNANIEYYTDEKGNIRKRKVGKKTV